jgi:hypothetical protein
LDICMLFCNVLVMRSLYEAVVWITFSEVESGRDKVIVGLYIRIVSSRTCIRQMNERQTTRTTNPVLETSPYSIPTKAINHAGQLRKTGDERASRDCHDRIFISIVIPATFIIT